MTKNEVKVKAVMEQAKAVSYLSDIVQSLQAGKVVVANGPQSVELTPADAVKVELAAVQKVDRDSISLKISWRKEVSEYEPVDLTISANEPDQTKENE